MRKIAAHDLGLFVVPTGANAKEKAAFGKIVERGNLFGQEQRIALWYQRNAGPEPERGGDSRGPGECDEGVEEPAIGLRDLAIRRTREGRGALHRHDRMFPDP